MRYHLKNYGKTPATITGRSQEIVHIDDLAEDDPNYVPVRLPNEIVIEAGGISETMTCRFRNVLQYSDAVSIARGDTAFFFYGNVKYVDAVSPEPHERRFIWFCEGGRFHRSHRENYHKNT